jgi:purine-nucleoside phosphorylase
MPGDPKRAELIANKYLQDAVLINDVRGMKAYTGYFEGKKISVMASGMGMPSMGIYSYELYKFYDVDRIIRIGSCGSYSPDLKLLDIILVNKTYTEGNYALTLNNEDVHIETGDEETNQVIEETAKELGTSYIRGDMVCSECFDWYMTDFHEMLKRVPDNINVLGSEMEAFALFYNAKLLNKKAACLLSVVDSHYFKEQIGSEEREKSLDEMIKLALKSAIKE